MSDIESSYFKPYTKAECLKEVREHFVEVRRLEAGINAIASLDDESIFTYAVLKRKLAKENDTLAYWIRHLIRFADEP